MTYIRTLGNGKSQVIKDIAFCSLLNNVLPPADKSITDLISEFDAEILRRDRSVTKDALNNVHGDWYEWLLAISAWNYAVRNPDSGLAILTPNVSQFDVSRLYNDKLYDLIQDLKSKVFASSAVQLISSNPDFVLIDRHVVDVCIGDLEPITEITPDIIYFIDNIYRKFPGTCNFNNIFGYISVKTSFRPDRRLQIPHEGSLMKAIYTHLQTREWIINPIGLKYYAFATRVGPSDRTALKTVATHSITTVHSLPQAAVDEVFEINSLTQAELVFSQIFSR